MVFVSHQPPIVAQPGDGAFDFPATPIAAELTAILRRRSFAATSMRADQIASSTPDSAHTFMRRELDEIIIALGKMLTRRSVALPDLSAIKSAFNSYLEKLFAWLTRQSAIELIAINYNELIAEPHGAVQRVARFIPLALQVDQMLTAFDRDLYRNRDATESSELPR